MKDEPFIMPGTYHLQKNVLCCPHLMACSEIIDFPAAVCPVKIKQLLLRLVYDAPAATAVDETDDGKEVDIDEDVDKNQS